MKIVQLNTTYGDADSTGRNVKELNTYFNENGNESYVFVNKITDKKKNTIGNIKLFSNPFDEKIHAVLSRITGLQGYFSVLSTMVLLKQIKDIAPDVVILNVLHSNCVNFGMLFGFLAKFRIATVIVLHDCFFFTGHCCHYTDVNCDRWKRKCGRCPSLRKWNKSLFYDTSEKSLRDKRKWISKIENVNVVAVSKWMENEARQSLLSSSNIETIYNWVDLDLFRFTEEKPAKLPETLGKYIAVCVASYWDSDKGTEEIIEVSKKIENIIVIVIGRSDGQFEKYDNIFEVGMITNMEEMVRYYSIADVFLNPSRQETFGKTTAEALSCGTPAIVYDTTACKELVDDSRGKLVDRFDIKKFINAVKTVLKNGKKHYSLAARCYAEENFDGKKNMNNYLRLLEKSVKRTKE